MVKIKNEKDGVIDIGVFPIVEKETSREFVLEVESDSKIIKASGCSCLSLTHSDDTISGGLKQPPKKAGESFEKTIRLYLDNGSGKVAYVKDAANKQVVDQNFTTSVIVRGHIQNV